MEPTTQMKLSARQLLKAAYSKTNGRKDLMWKTIGVVILAMIPLLLSEVVTQVLVDMNVPMAAMYFVTFVLIFVTSLFSSVILASLYYVIAAPERQGIRWGMSMMWSSAVPLAIFILIVQAIAMGAFAFFVLPIFVVSIYLLPALWVYVTEHRKGLDAIIRSTSLVFGMYWRVVGVLLLMALIVFALYLIIVALLAVGVFAGMYQMVASSLLFGLGLIFVASLPFVMAWVFLFALNYTFLLTQHLQIMRPQGAYSALEWGRAKLWYRIFLFIGILVTIIYYGTMAYTSVNEAAYGPAKDEWSMEDEWYIRE